MEEEARKKPNSETQNAKPDFTDITIFGTPLPQATSTVERKSTYVLFEILLFFCQELNFLLLVKTLILTVQYLFFMMQLLISAFRQDTVIKRTILIITNDHV